MSTHVGGHLDVGHLDVGRVYGRYWGGGTLSVGVLVTCHWKSPSQRHILKSSHLSYNYEMPRL